MDDLGDLASLSPRDAARALEIAAALARWREVPRGAPLDRAKSAEGIPLGLGRAELFSLAHEVSARGEDGDVLAREASERSVHSRTLLLATDSEIAHALAHDTSATIALLESLRDAERSALGARVAGLFPEIAALTAADPRAVPPDYESTKGSQAPLLDHLSIRALSRKLLGVQCGDLTRFQPFALPRGEARGLSTASFESLYARGQRVERAGLLPLVRIALVFRDVAKPIARAAVAVARSATRLAHNEAAAALLLARAREPASGIALVAQSLSRSPFDLADVALFVAAHGLIGQHLRGEVPLAALARFAVGARRMRRVLALGHSDGAALIVDALSLLDACDVASVREGLFDDTLAVRFSELESRLGGLLAERDSSLDHVSGMSEALARLEGHSPDPRDGLMVRLERLRATRIAANPAARDDLTNAVARLDAREATALRDGLSECQLWYAEAATGDLAPDATLKLLALALSCAGRAGLRASTPREGTVSSRRRLFHVDWLPLAEYTRSLGNARTYALRLLEAVLAPLTVADALGLDGEPTPLVRMLLGEEVESERAGLGTLAIAERSERAIALEWRASREAEALLTLLGVYERKSSAAFHATLKSLCDLYNLRKDDFDRLHAEAAYLDAMNAARSDKARLCDYVIPGNVLEVGPGGGVVLDLLADRFPQSRIVGLDVSRAVVDALLARKARESKRWEILEGDAFDLARLTGERSLSTVVFCSILHEIFSYVTWNDGDARGPGRFRIGSVQAIVAAAFRALAPRGRIIVRDGVLPEPGTRVMEFKTTRAADTFALYAREFEGRTIQFESAGPRRVRIPAADAHAFLYTYVWGPASFPYEIREQYGVETYDRYANVLVSACAEADPEFRAELLPLNAEVRSYLQPGYIEHLASEVALYEADGETAARLPDSNALWVLTKVPRET